MWMNRGTSKRALWKPLGDLSNPNIVAANCMVSRQALYLWLYLATGKFIVMEQPVGSLLEYHPRMAEIKKVFPIYRVTISMGGFGAASAKPTWLYSGHEFIQEIKHWEGCATYNGPAVEVVSRVVSPNTGKIMIMGGKDLKATQAYPPAFGKALAELYLAHRSDIRDQAKKLRDRASMVTITKESLLPVLKGKKAWHDAKLKGVWERLTT